MSARPKSSPVAGTRASARTGTQVRARGAVATLGLTGLAAALVTVGGSMTAADAAEDISMVVWVAGWVLAVWAGVAITVCAVGQVREAVAGGRPTWREIGMLLLSGGVLVLAGLTHPVAGSGEGSATRADDPGPAAGAAAVTCQGLT